VNSKLNAQEISHEGIEEMFNGNIGKYNTRRIGAPKIISGKPPELLIVNRNITVENLSKDNESKIYTEAEIMKMPTIIVLKPLEQFSGIFIFQCGNF
jgi:hypothetical protein